MPWLGAIASPGTTEKLIVVAVVEAALAVNVYVMGAPSNTEAEFEVSVYVTGTSVMATVTAAAVVDRSVPVLGVDNVTLTPSPVSGLIVSAVKGTTMVLETSPAANVKVPVVG